MDQLWVEVIKQAPALGILTFLVVNLLGVLVYLVRCFLKHIREMTADFKEMATRFESTIEEANVRMDDQHNMFRERTERALEKNTSVTARNNLLLEQFNSNAANGRLCEHFKPVPLKEDS